MHLHVLEFSPPMTGFEAFFNTFRLGTAWSKRLSRGDKVLLMDKPHALVFGIAEVISVKVGPLQEMAQLHAYMNHNQLGLAKNGAPARLIASSTKRYGPHKCDPDKKFTVIYLRRLYGDATMTLPEGQFYDES